MKAYLVRGDDWSAFFAADSFAQAKAFSVAYWKSPDDFFSVMAFPQPNLDDIAARFDTPQELDATEVAQRLGL